MMAAAAAAMAAIIVAISVIIYASQTKYFPVTFLNPSTLAYSSRVIITGLASELKRPVYLSAMPDAQSGYCFWTVINAINYPVTSLPDAAQACAPDFFNAS